MTEAEGFTEEIKGVSHHVVWGYLEIGPEEFEAWVCETHDRIWFGGCNKGGDDDI